MAQKRCEKCERVVGHRDKTCAYCGAKVPMGNVRMGCVIAVLVALLIMVALISFGKYESSQSVDNPSNPHGTAHESQSKDQGGN